MLPCRVVARRFVIAPVQRMHGCTATSNYEQPNFSDFFRLLNLSKNKYAGPPDSRTKIYAARASCGSSSCISIDICCPRPTSAANPPAAAATVGGRDRRTDTRQFFDACRTGLLYLYSLVCPYGVLPCRRYVSRACSHWPFSRLSGSRC